MGKLKPGATYIYENDGDTIWARESGSPDRIMVGHGPESTRRYLEENMMWHNIRQMARVNPALQEALDRAIMIYELSKKDGQT